MSKSLKNNNRVAKHPNIVIVEGISDQRILKLLLADIGLDKDIDVFEFSGIVNMVDISNGIIPLINNALENFPNLPIRVFLIWDRDHVEDEAIVSKKQSSSNDIKKIIKDELIRNYSGSGQADICQCLKNAPGGLPVFLGGVHD
jgi:hypothetical protein